jgi:hypothetical protein
VDEKLPAVIFDQPDPRAPWFYEHRQVLAEREPEFEQLLGWDALGEEVVELEAPAFRDRVAGGVEGAVGVVLGLVRMGEVVGDPHSEI